MKFFYGISTNYIDITNQVYEKCKITDDLILISKDDDERAKKFGDPQFGSLKNIIFVDDKGKLEIIQHYEDVIVESGKLIRNHERRKSWWDKQGKFLSDPKDRLDMLHNYINLKYGSMKDEYDEQLMAMTFIKPHDVVLELGGNIGRNSLVIASILDDQRNLVTLESSEEISKQLTENKSINMMQFHIESSALSKQKLIQKGWETIPSDIILPGYFQVKTITYDELLKKYQKSFTVLVADCEGALYFILKDEPNFLKGINTIITENDYRSKEQFEYVKNIFIKEGFKLKVSTSGGFGYSYLACKDEFFQTWTK